MICFIFICDDVMGVLYVMGGVICDWVWILLRCLMWVILISEVDAGRTVSLREWRATFATSRDIEMGLRWCSLDWASLLYISTPHAPHTHLYVSLQLKIHLDFV